MGPELEQAVSSIVDMGFEREMVLKAMRRVPSACCCSLLSSVAAFLGPRVPIEACLCNADGGWRAAQSTCRAVLLAMASSSQGGFQQPRARGRVPDDGHPGDGRSAGRAGVWRRVTESHSMGAICLLT